MEVYNDMKQGEKGVWFSIAAYVILSMLKLAVGHMSGSEALFADGLNNSTDIVASIAVLIGLKISRKPPDHDHPYGHFRAETISALVASFIMAVVGIQVVYQAFGNLFHMKSEAPDMIAAWTALFCAAAMYAVYRYNFRLARKINSHAMMAAAKDNRSDALVSIGAFAGIAASRLGFPRLDAIVALIVGIIICKTAWDIFHEASHALTDGFDKNKLDQLKKTIVKTPGVKGMKDIRARTHGNQVFVDVVIQVDPALSVVESHDITEEVERRMRERHKISEVHIHIEPVETTNSLHTFGKR